MSDSWQIAINKEPREWKPRFYVSLNRRGEIAMNDRAFQAIARPANVTLLYDEKTRSIGVKFPVAVDRHFFPARRYGRGRRMRIVRAAKMIKQFGIEVTNTLVFQNVEVKYFDRSPMLVLELGRARELEARRPETGDGRQETGPKDATTQNPRPR